MQFYCSAPLCSNSYDSHPFTRKRCTTNKKRQLQMERNTFRSKNCQKTGFLGFLTPYCTYSVRNFIVVSNDFKITRSSPIGSITGINFKKGIFSEKNLRFCPKNLRKFGFLLGFHLLLHKIAPYFNCCAPMTPKPIS